MFGAGDGRSFGGRDGGLDELRGREGRGSWSGTTANCECEGLATRREEGREKRERERDVPSKSHK